MADRKSETAKSEDIVQACKRVVDLIALRDHSELELRKKLEISFGSAAIEQAITEAKRRKWIPATPADQAALSEKVAENLHRQRKGVHWINDKLERAGLPPVVADESAELEKALILARKSLAGAKSGKDPAAKIARALSAKGFDPEIVQRVLRELNLEFLVPSLEEEL